MYLGGYECEEHAAEAYDIAALKSKGSRVRTNFELRWVGVVGGWECVLAGGRPSFPPRGSHLLLLPAQPAAPMEPSPL